MEQSAEPSHFYGYVTVFPMSLLTLLLRVGVIEPFCWARKLLEKCANTKNEVQAMIRKISMLVADLSIISKFQIKLNVFSISSGSNKKLLQTPTLSVRSSLTKIIISGRRSILHRRLRPCTREGLITAKIRKRMGRLFM